MNKDLGTVVSELGDSFAIKLQNLRQVGKKQPLIKVDYQKEASQAPFQFDLANSLLHRTGCSTIVANDKKTAFYGVWEPKDKDFALACKKCRPVPIIAEAKMKKDSTPLDIVFGFISFIDQFGSVFIERGREYRNTERGQQMSKSFDKIIKELDHQQKEGLNLVLSSFDGLVKAFQGLSDELQPVKEEDNKKSKNLRPKKVRRKRQPGEKNLDKKRVMQ